MAATGHQASAPGTAAQPLSHPLQVQSTHALDGPSVSGSEISVIVGVRIATPLFGTGFNFCIGAHCSCMPFLALITSLPPSAWLHMHGFP
jgi:hypothetical protein